MKRLIALGIAFLLLLAAPCALALSWLDYSRTVVVNNVWEFHLASGWTISNDVTGKKLIGPAGDYNEPYFIKVHEEQIELCMENSQKESSIFLIITPIEEEIDFATADQETIEEFEKSVLAEFTTQVDENHYSFEDVTTNVITPALDRPWVSITGNTLLYNAFPYAFQYYYTIANGHVIMISISSSKYYSVSSYGYMIAETLRYLPTEESLAGLVYADLVADDTSSVGIIGGGDGSTGVIAGESAVNIEKNEPLDTLVWVLIILLVIILAVLVVSIVRARRKKAKEREQTVAEQQNTHTEHDAMEETSVGMEEKKEMVKEQKTEKDEYAYLKTIPPSIKQLNGVKGWLMFFKVVLWINIVRAGIACLMAIDTALDIAGAGEGVAVLLIVILSALFDLAALIAVLVLFNKRNKAFRWVYLGMTVVGIILGIVSGDLFSVTGIAGILWMIYLFMSKRVKMTFHIPFDEKELERYWLEEPNKPGSKRKPKEKA